MRIHIVTNINISNINILIKYFNNILIKKLLLQKSIINWQLKMITFKSLSKHFQNKKKLNQTSKKLKKL